ncbi:hypothetical protein M011DRAFT_406797 [Sporormia fimetaria CBS 119925]|uniref:Roadblock/LAMTOR2 domain-containing protein n=1 Tax=Sporormia fimetaria CBS 119925 TaxID=1340428 RepID=A0A6A6V3S2_9PLEO|nr:hypothetical protein M011DRAFT_406797 [Sporormia fimetaria CBS 119925]
MLNAIKVSELLAKNVDSKLYPRIFVMSPNGTLMAYSTPVDIKELRDQAALVSMAWKEHETALAAKQPKDADPQSTLETLTIEFQHNNIIVRALQPRLLLVLVGGVPPSRKAFFKITAETHGDPRYPPTESTEDEEPSDEPRKADGAIHPGNGSLTVGKQKTPSIMSNMSQRDRDLKVGALHIQRKKIDALTEFMRADFDSKGFVMPDDQGLT